jgi:hypothetical protein
MLLQQLKGSEMRYTAFLLPQPQKPKPQILTTMIRHIVMFKLKSFETETEKTAAATKLLRRLDELPSKIDLIRKYEAGIDVRKLEWSYDISLVMDFDTMADLDAYTIHPAHKEFVTFNKDFSIAKVCVDYEV